MDDKFHRNRKVRALRRVRGGTEALGVWVYWWSWCLDDPEQSGVVPSLELSASDSRAASLLVEHGLWEPAADGFHFHDFEEYNVRAAKLDAKREADRVRIANKRATVACDKSDKSQEVAATVAPASPSRPVPVPVPVPDPGGAGFSEHDTEADYTWNRRELEREITAERGKPWSLPSNRFGLVLRADAVVEEIRAFAASEKADPRAVCATAFRAWSERQVIVKRSTEPHLWLDDWAGALPARASQ
jgi:hypothetical protein